MLYIYIAYSVIYTYAGSYYTYDPYAIHVNILSIYSMAKQCYIHGAMKEGAYILLDIHIRRSRRCYARRNHAYPALHKPSILYIHPYASGSAAAMRGSETQVRAAVFQVQKTQCVASQAQAGYVVPGSVFGRRGAAGGGAVFRRTAAAGRCAAAGAGSECRRVR